MSEEVLTDDQSHYEVSLTAGQAFLAFVLLLLSLAASFAFGLLIGRGQADDKVVAHVKEPAVVNEASAAPAKTAAVRDDDFKQPEVTTAPAKIAEEGGGQTPPPVHQKAPAQNVPSPSSVAPPPSVAPARSSASAAATGVTTGGPAPSPAVPFYAQLLSTADQKTAEALAAKVIDGGFTSAYVERGTSDKGTVFRVRVKFPSEAEARAAETKLRTFSKDVWITK